MQKLVWILAPLIFSTPIASAEIFKCAPKDGMPHYQNFPCAIDRPDLLPSSSGAAVPPTGAPMQDETKAPSPNQQTIAKVAASVDAPRIGMTAEEVRAVWGEPSNVYWDELVDGRAEVWSFSSSRSVQFDLKGRVAMVQR